MGKLLLIAGVIIVLLVALGSGGSSDSVGPTEAAPAANSQSDHTDRTETMRVAFMNGCTGEGGGADECECMFNELMDQYGMSGMLDLASKSEDEMMSSLMPAAYSCI